MILDDLAELKRLLGGRGDDPVSENQEAERKLEEEMASLERLLGSLPFQPEYGSVSGEELEKIHVAEETKHEGEMVLQRGQDAVEEYLLFRRYMKELGVDMTVLARVARDVLENKRYHHKMGELVFGHEHLIGEGKACEKRLKEQRRETLECIGIGSVGAFLGSVLASYFGTGLLSAGIAAGIIGCGGTAISAVSHYRARKLATESERVSSEAHREYELLKKERSALDGYRLVDEKLKHLRREGTPSVIDYVRAYGEERLEIPYDEILEKTLAVQLEPFIREEEERGRAEREQESAAILESMLPAFEERGYSRKELEGEYLHLHGHELGGSTVPVDGFVARVEEAMRAVAKRREKEEFDITLSDGVYCR